MAGGWDNQAASRPNVYQVLNWTSTGLVQTSKFAIATQQIRVMSQIAGWGTINQTTSDSILATSAGGVGMLITGLSTGFPGAATALSGSPYPEYFTVTPGQIFCFASTSTSTASLTVTEMA
jgi:hypothetical protein